jgi:hypothetical protein
MKTQLATPATPSGQDPLPTAETPRPSGELVEAVRHYASQKPQAVALWCLAIGFVLGWKLKIW